MSQNVGIVVVPSRFEALEDAVGQQRVADVLIESPIDLTALQAAVLEVRAARQGKLLFLLGRSGIGKTTLAASSQIYLPTLISDVVTPPPDYEVPLNDLPTWLSTNVPAREKGANTVTLVNLDGRELPAADENVQRAAVVNLNAYLRRNAHLLAVWPVIKKSFAEDMIKQLNQVGGSSALASIGIHEVQGIGKDRYFDALQLILNATGTRLEDAAITRDEAERLVDAASSLGSYLGDVQKLVFQRYDVGNQIARLPRVSIVLSSNGDSAASCRMLRRGNKYLADPERLLQYSRANIADDWRRLGTAKARHALPFIASLFEVRLLHLTSSMVVNACAFSEDDELRTIVRKYYPKPVKANAANSLKNSSLVRALNHQEDVGPASAAISKEVSAAYLAVQKLSQERHRVINEAIVRVLTEQLDINLPSLKFEYRPHEHDELRVDCWYEREERPETLEFTHRKDNEISSASISSYVLSKVMDYARDYKLIT